MVHIITHLLLYNVHGYQVAMWLHAKVISMIKYIHITMYNHTMVIKQQEVLQYNVTYSELG